MTNLLDIITPINLLEEKAKFFTSSTYHPQFHYMWEEQNIEPDFSIKKKYPLWQAVRDQDHDRIVRAASDLFEVEITHELTDKARTASVLTGPVYHGSAVEYAAAMREALDLFGLTDFTIEITDQTGFNSRPKHEAQKLLVSKDIHFGLTSIEGGVRHELVHILRYKNGKHNRIKRSQRFLPTEEGLASWCQDHTNDDNGLAQHAMEYLASGIGIKGTLRDIYGGLCELGMDQDLAWKRASRHKFGFVDTSKPGDILKPAMYFANEMRVDELSSNERVRLFVGKINQDELSSYPTYQGIWPAEQIIEYFKL